MKEEMTNPGPRPSVAGKPQRWGAGPGARHTRERVAAMAMGEKLQAVVEDGAGSNGHRARVGS